MRKSAQSIIEVTLGIAILIPAMLVIVDLAVIVLGMGLNNAACRNAARAAASGSPNEAAGRARTAVDHMMSRGSSGFISNFRLVDPVEVKITQPSSASAIDPQAARTHAAGPVVGTVTVTTEVEVQPFAIHLLCFRPSPFKIRSQETFPISYIMPASAAQITDSPGAPSTETAM